LIEATVAANRWDLGVSLAGTRWGLALAILVAAFCVSSATPGLAQTATPTTSGEGAKSSSPKKDVLTIPIILAREKIDKPLPLSLLDLPPADDGIAGAQLGLKDNNTTGRFVNQEFILDVVEDADPDKLIKDVLAKVEGGAQFVLADVGPDTLVKLADTVAGKDVLIINYGAADDRLREEDCRPQVMHTAPTRAMIADALAQYLVWKKWRRWFLVLGPKEEDKLFADALRRAAKRFGAKIVEVSKFSSRSRPSLRKHPTTTFSSLLTRGTCSATTYPTERGTQDLLQGPPGSLQQAGTRPSKCGVERNSKTVSSGWPIAVCVPSTTMPGWLRASSARLPRARIRAVTKI